MGSNVFLYAPKYDSIQTWLFKTNIYDLKNFLTDEAIDSMANSCIEYAFKAVYDNYKNELAMKRFSAYPDVWGVNSSGNQYISSKGKLHLRNLFPRAGYYTVR